MGKNPSIRFAVLPLPSRWLSVLGGSCLFVTQIPTKEFLMSAQPQGATNLK